MGFGFENETMHYDIAAYILEYHTNQLTEGSTELDFFHDNVFKQYVLTHPVFDSEILIILASDLVCILQLS